MPKNIEKVKAIMEEILKKMTREQVNAIANGMIDALKFFIDNDDDELLKKRMTEYISFFYKIVEGRSIPIDLKMAMNDAVINNDTSKLAIILPDYVAALTMLFPITEQPGNVTLVNSYLRWKASREKNEHNL